MDGLGQVLELLYYARDRVTTFQGVIYSWKDMDVLREAMSRDERTLRRSVLTSRNADVQAAPPAGIEEEVSRLWVDKPSRSKLEIDKGDDKGHSIRLHVDNLWWSYDPAHGAVTNENTPYAGLQSPTPIYAGFGRMMDPCNIIPAIRIEGLEPTTIAEREAILITATVRDPGARGHVGLWPGADACQMAVDSTYGVLLSTHVSMGGATLYEDEALQVRFNEPIPDDVFTFDPPPGVQVRPFLSRH